MRLFLATAIPAYPLVKPAAMELRHPQILVGAGFKDFVIDMDTDHNESSAK
jgi:hypothetical protein